MLEFLEYLFVAAVLAFVLLYLRGWDYFETAICAVGEALDPILDRIHREGRSPSLDQWAAITGICVIFAITMSVLF